MSVRYSSYQALFPPNLEVFLLSCMFLSNEHLRLIRARFHFFSCSKMSLGLFYFFLPLVDCTFQTVLKFDYIFSRFEWKGKSILLQLLTEIKYQLVFFLILLHQPLFSIFRKFLYCSFSYFFVFFRQVLVCFTSSFIIFFVVYADLYYLCLILFYAIGAQCPHTFILFFILLTDLAYKNRVIKPELVFLALLNADFNSLPIHQHLFAFQEDMLHQWSPDTPPAFSQKSRKIPKRRPIS